MPEVPPDNPNRELEERAEAVHPASSQERPLDGPLPGDPHVDVVFTPPRRPSLRSREEQFGGASSADATPPEVSSSGAESRPGEGAPGAPPAEQATVPSFPTDGSQTPTAEGSSAEAVSLSTTGVPHYLPPASPPGLAGEPGVAPGPSEAGVGEAIAAVPPRRSRSILRPIGRGLREIAETIVLALLIFLLVRAVVQNFQVEGRSMEPTLQSNWYLLVNKAIYWEINLETISKFIPFVDPGDHPTRYLFRGPRRGDIIVFKSPTQGRGQPERDFIKRVIGLPGETVEIRDCTVFINGEPLDEPYIAERPAYTYGPETVPPDQYFVLGDNRNNSSDSHSWGMLPKENIIGLAWITYWPFSAFGLVDNTSVKPGGGATEAATGPLVTDKPAPACP